MLRRHRQFVLRPSRILIPSCNFVLTGTGIATFIRQNILEFLAVGSCAIHNLCNCSTATFAATVNWTQVDTPSVADDPDSDDNYDTFSFFPVGKRREKLMKVVSLVQIPVKAMESLTF